MVLEQPWNSFRPVTLRPWLLDECLSRCQLQGPYDDCRRQCGRLDEVQKLLHKMVGLLEEQLG